jgi:NAD-dependent deacetylase
MVMSARDYRKIVVLTGAGISAESGVPTFRDANGLWENHRIEDVATPEAFSADPRLVWKFYSARRRGAQSVQPNPAHHALARFSLGCDRRATGFTLITQNVDGLHERAHETVGARMPLTMHGKLAQSRCDGCEKVVADTQSYFDDEGNALPGAMPRNSLGIPLSLCCGELLRPHIVWFGEMPLHMEEIDRAVSECDLFVTIGTSGNVYPAAGFLRQAKEAGARTVCLNKEPLPQRQMVDHFLEGPAAELVPRFFATG